MSEWTDPRADKDTMVAKKKFLSLPLKVNSLMNFHNTRFNIIFLFCLLSSKKLLLNRFDQFHFLSTPLALLAQNTITWLF